MKSFDCIVIGGGQAGPFLTARLSDAGRRTALIERRFMGGTCVNDGCTPTKTLVASARVAWLAGRASDFGINVAGPVTSDMAAIKARKEKVVLTSRNGLDSWMEGLPNAEVFRGHGRFTSPHTVEVNGEELQAAEIFLNTGCRAVVPKWPGIERTPYLTNTTILELDVLPKHLVIVGGSYVGLEFAQVFRRFGSEVTVIERGTRIASREDEDVSTAIREILEAEGIEVLAGCGDFSSEPTTDGIAMITTRAGVSHRIEGSHLLIAVGRQPNVEDLGLDKAGVAQDARGFIVTDEELRTSQKHIYALGDVNGRGAFTHTSYNDFEIVAANLLDGKSRKVTDRIPAYGLYTDPPLGRAGMSESEALHSGRRVLRAVRPMTRISRAFERDETKGLMKILADADTREILGVAFLGVEGDEVMQGLIDAMAGRLTIDQLKLNMHVHPTVAEYIPTLMGEFKPIG